MKFEYVFVALLCLGCLLVGYVFGTMVMLHKVADRMSDASSRERFAECLVQE